MAIDQSKLGQLIQEQMEAIENDPDVADDAEIGAVVSIVEVTSESQQQAGMRIRANVPPHIAVGLLESGKAIQLKMMLG